MSKSRSDICLKCGESRGAIMNGPLICWDGYDVLGRHRFAPWPDEAEVFRVVQIAENEDAEP